ncbi:MAG: excinuclease ABC subunit C [Bacteroidales bacterium]|nr:excinuclease ABC subunit C [Bacteroidales bacterium]
MIDASINPHIDRIAVQLRTIPESPGVYQHLDAEGTVIYVGKARNLQRRVSSYFSHYDEKSAKIKMLVRHISDIRVTVVATEVDALLLENSLIKRYQPRYNSMLKDDKSYPYLCITQEEYPRLLYTRRHNLKGQYFGPYPNGNILRELQAIIRQLFQYRTCNTMGKRPCMKHQIGLCGAPCAGLQSREEYHATIENIRRILRGDFGEIVESLKERMYSLAQELRFEEAEGVKRKIRLLEEYQSRSTVVDSRVKDVDVVSIISDEQYAYIHFMRIKNGAIIYSFSNEIKKQLDESDEEVLSTIIPTLHEQTASTAKEIIVPFVVGDLPADYLEQNVSPRGDRKKLLELSLRNVESYQKQCRHQRALTSGEAAPKALRTLERLQALLALPRLPMEIECFDNSNIQGAHAVAGMVHFTAGKPNRSLYRKYNIKTVEGPDDYASMSEVVERRYRRLQEEGGRLPDLLIVDGGEGQMSVAREVIVDRLHLDLPIVGLAKDDRHHTHQLLRYDERGQIAVAQLRPTDPLFHLLEQIQNEVHRFAITFHRAKRSKATFRTALTDIAGIGPKTAHDLLLHFGSVRQVASQTEADLAAVVGPSKAATLYAALHG